MFVIVTYSVLFVIACFGCAKVKTDFKVNFFIEEDAYVHKFFELNDKYFDQGFTAVFYVNNSDIDYSSHEVQLQMLEFEDNLKRSRECAEIWFVENTISSWYGSFHQWVNNGNCYVLRSGIQPFEKTIDEDFFYPCLWEFFD